MALHAVPAEATSRRRWEPNRPLHRLRPGPPPSSSQGSLCGHREQVTSLLHAGESVSVVAQGKPGLQEQCKVTQGVNQVQNNRARPRVFISVINTESAPSVYAGTVPAGAACGCARPFVGGAGGEGEQAGSTRPPRPGSTVVPRGSWREGGCRDRRPRTLGKRPGVTGEADHPGVTKQRWAPSSSPFPSGVPKGRRSQLWASVRSGAPEGQAPRLHTQPVRLHLQAQVFSLHHKTSASRVHGRRPMHVEAIGKQATPPGSTPCPLRPRPPHGPLQPGALAQPGAPIPEAV